MRLAISLGGTFSSTPSYWPCTCLNDCIDFSCFDFIPSFFSNNASRPSVLSQLSASLFLSYGLFSVGYSRPVFRPTVPSPSFQISSSASNAT